MMLKVTAGEKYSAILGLGGYRPRRVVDNAEICTMIDSSDEWIRTRSGIIERRWASADETIQMMSIAAARKALDRAGAEDLRVGRARRVGAHRQGLAAARLLGSATVEPRFSLASKSATHHREVH